MQFAILGPLEVRDDNDRPVPIAGARLRALLVRLIVDAGRPVSVDALVGAVWGDDAPAGQANALQTLISRLRRSIGVQRVVQVPGGYRLAVDAQDVDVTRFQQLAGAGSAALAGGRCGEATALLTEALALWRGPGDEPLCDGRPPAGFTDRMRELRRSVVGDRIEAELRLADPARAGALIADLEVQVCDDPLDERFAGQLVRALAVQGRQAAALHAYERLRVRLADELGVDPSRELQDIHLAALRGELEPAAPTPVATLRRSNLKAQLTSFVGREAEVARIGKSLEQNRLVTVVGPGGAGKTRLACEAAAYVVDTAPDGVWLVELAPVTSAADIAQTVLAAVGLRETHLLERRGRVATRDARTRLLDALADKRAVLVLDNCEHLIDASARLADQLLAACPDLRVLATSREPLGIVGEVLLGLRPLAQPEPAAGLADVLEYPAVRLFADRAADVAPDFTVDDATVGEVVEIVRRLDGLPLAIELAAARLRTMPLADIASRLSDRFRLLTGGSRTALPRHRTLRAVVEWSWDLLTVDERRLIEQLAVFPSGVTLASAAAVAGVDAAEVADVLASLVDKSLLAPVGDGRRMRMLETIREYGIERLAERGELGRVRRLHADYFAAMLAEAEPHLTRADQLPWFELLTDERDNLLAALRQRCDAGDAAGAVAVATAMAAHSMLLGAHAELVPWLLAALAVPGEVPPELRIVARSVQALNCAAAGVGDADEVETNMQLLRELAAQFEQLKLPAAPFATLLAPAVAFFAGEPDTCARYIQRVIDDGDAWSGAAARMFRAALAENDGDIELMRREAQAALIEFRALGERWGTASTLRSIGQVRLLDADLVGALAAYEEALVLTTELRSTDDQGYTLGRLAEVALRLDDVERARRYVGEMRDWAAANASSAESAFGIAMLGVVESRAGNIAAAAALQQQALDRLDAVPREHAVQGHLRAIVYSLAARSAFEAADVSRADALIREAYTAAVGTRDRPVIASVGVVVADVVAAGGDAVTAALMLGAARRLRGADDPTSPDIRSLTQRLCDVLGPEGFDSNYAQGAALDPAAAVERLAPPTP